MKISYYNNYAQSISDMQLGLSLICRHNNWHNWYLLATGIMLAKYVAICGKIGSNLWQNR